MEYRKDGVVPNLIMQCCILENLEQMIIFKKLKVISESILHCFNEF